MVKLLMEYGRENGITLELNKRNNQGLNAFVITTNNNDNIDMIHLLIDSSEENNIEYN